MKRNLYFILSQYMNLFWESQPFFRIYEYRGGLDDNGFGLIVYDLQQMKLQKKHEEVYYHFIFTVNVKEDMPRCAGWSYFTVLKLCYNVSERAKTS